MANIPVGIGDLTDAEVLAVIAELDQMISELGFT